MTAALPRPTVPARTFTQLFSSTRRGARLARRFTAHQLDTWGLPYGSDLSHTAALLVAELAANAVLHGRVGGRDFRLTLTLEAAGLRIEVTDTRCERLPTGGRRPPADDAESGRGMLLVEALADRWGVRTGPFPLKTVWAELST
ncbi:ATP-binding protein [Streptomyces sp. DSM 42041]|uniref:ATP-binding protein n=1 Tax=Streptomyces hazeniae TaxID=3075538 RepID=A0ABU2NTU9_9ACTN|nr:ATP-binding protein [Streptomyces sp. DSM 42041]MDT0380405.1 ATP-binding protein [Streptomyces sp. DSM 42041]